MKLSILKHSLFALLISAALITLPAYSREPKNTGGTRAATVADQSKQTMHVTKKLYGEIDQVNYALRAAGVTLESDHLPALVGAVRLGSPSRYAGLLENDKILSAKITENKLHLYFERDGKRYAISVHTSPALLIPASPISDSQPLSGTLGKTPLGGEVLRDSEPDRIGRIAKYNIVIVIDKSGSMNDEVTIGEESKWQWCTNFVSTFAKKVTPSLNGRDIIMVPFNTTYTINPERTPIQMLNFFESTRAEGGTDLGTPLGDVIRKYKYAIPLRPLLVIVLTDGMSNTGPRVEDVLIEASQHMNSDREVRVSILEIGETFGGHAMLKYLDDYLVYEGAKYDFIDVTSFHELRKTTLVDVLQKSIVERPITPVVKAMQSEIDQLKAEIEKQRKLDTRSNKELKPVPRNP